MGERHVATSEEIKFELLCGAEFLRHLRRFTGFHSPFRAALLERLLIEKKCRLIVCAALSHGSIRDVRWRVRIMPLPLLDGPDDDTNRLYRRSVAPLCGLGLFGNLDVFSGYPHLAQFSDRCSAHCAPR